MDQQTIERRFGYDRHLVLGQVGRFHVLAGLDQRSYIVITLEELDSHSKPLGNFHQIVFLGQDANKALELGIKTGDIIMVGLEDLKARAYMDNFTVPPRAVGYFESIGRDPFILSRPEPEEPGLPGSGGGQGSAALKALGNEGPEGAGGQGNGGKKEISYW
ncbi:MAG: hypothetical protein LBU69_04665 [Deltaproteobacteria bacterium]|jgi:hypothetical protein|nr:hypothetical protein [Deltaproteobacteria bacterium]